MFKSKSAPNPSDTKPSPSAVKEPSKDPFYRGFTKALTLGFVFIAGASLGSFLTIKYPPSLESPRGVISTPRRFDTTDSFREFLRVEKGLDVPANAISQVQMPQTEILTVRNYTLALSRSSAGNSNIFLAASSLTSDIPVSVYTSDAQTVRTICDWGHAAGCQFGGTNVFVYASNGTDFSSAIRTHERIHEFFHFVTGRITNNVFEYRDPHNRPITLPSPTRFVEGTNELLTLSAIGSIDTANDTVRYPIETRVALILRLICTPADLFAATFSGDWHLVQQKVDRELGRNVFGRLVSFMQGADVGAQAGEYEDPSACVPLEYLLRLIGQKPNLQRDFTALTQTDFIWRSSRETCDSEGRVVAVTAPPADSTPSPPSVSRPRRIPPRTRPTRLSVPDASVEVIPQPEVVLPPPRPRTLSERRFLEHLATLTNPAERDRYTRMYENSVAEAARMNGVSPGSAIVVVAPDGFISVRPTGL